MVQWSRLHSNRGSAMHVAHRDITTHSFRFFKMFYTYILKSVLNGSYYVGSCKDLSARLLLHNRKLVPSTRRYAPWNIAFYESYESLSLARKRELQIKKWKKRAAIENLIKHFEKI